MKLRGKNTGSIIYAYPVLRLCDGETDICYSSIKELNEEWEDYTPQEPLIKDKKICKAVRAWAEANRDIRQVTYEKNVQKAFCDFVDLESMARLRFNFIVPLLKCYEVYAIAELCGEEEDEN